MYRIIVCSKHGGDSHCRVANNINGIVGVVGNSSITEGRQMKSYIVTTLLLVLTACATPETILTKDGQYISCGGSSVGSVTGGYIGYSLQKDNDDKCVKDHVAIGYKQVSQ